MFQAWRLETIKCERKVPEGPQFNYSNVIFLRNLGAVILSLTMLFNLFCPSSIWKGVVLLFTSFVGGCYYLSQIVWKGKYENHVPQLFLTFPIVGILGLLSFLKILNTTAIIFWIFGLATGVHFGYLDSLPLFKNFDITPAEMKLWKWPQWTLFYGLISFFITIVLYVLPFISFGVMATYAIFSLGIVAISWFIYPVYVFHFHHYFIAAYFMPLLSLYGKSDAMVCFVNAILAGVYIQGIIRWGLAGIWQKNSSTKKHEEGTAQISSVGDNSQEHHH